MKAKSASALAVIGLFVSLHVSGCHVEHVTSGSPEAQKSREQMVDSDMDFDTSELHQFMGGVRGGLECTPN